MTNKKENKNAVFMDKITDFFAQDIFEATDEEILEEAQEDGVDVKAEAARISAVINGAVFAHGQTKLKAAKEAIEARRTGKIFQPLKIATLERKKQIINSVNSNDNLKRQITAAARNENELSERDLDVYLENLFDLGVIDENGNILCD